jgi:hypothetical protein
MKVSHVSPFVDVEKLGCVILLSMVIKGKASLHLRCETN